MMKKLAGTMLAVAAMLTASVVFAQEGPTLTAQAPLQPVPDAVSTQGAVSMQGSISTAQGPAVGAVPIPTQGVAIPLYHCVKYKDQRKIAPCAVPMIVMVKDPCAKCDPCNPCAPAACVAVQICVPPCSTCPPKVCCKRGGEYVSYDFGKYRVEIRSRNGVVKVDYDA
jgi:hypothetical protein